MQQINHQSRRCKNNIHSAQKLTSLCFWHTSASAGRRSRTNTHTIKIIDRGISSRPFSSCSSCLMSYLSVWREIIEIPNSGARHLLSDWSMCVTQDGARSCVIHACVGCVMIKASVCVCVSLCENRCFCITICGWKRSVNTVIFYVESALSENTRWHCTSVCVCVCVSVCVVLSPSSQAKIGSDFGESTARNITASSGKLHLTKCVCVCVCVCMHTSSTGLCLTICWPFHFKGHFKCKDRWYLFFRKSNKSDSELHRVTVLISHAQIYKYTHP